jgi:hypothetical protein
MIWENKKQACLVYEEYAMVDIASSTLPQDIILNALSFFSVFKIFLILIYKILIVLPAVTLEH